MTLVRDFYQEIINIIGSGSEACCVIPIGDPAFENAAHTTVTTKGQGALDGLVFTYSEARTGFDAPTIYTRNQFRTPIVPWNGTNEQADSPDADVWSRDDSAGEGFSIGAGINLVDATNSSILGKIETTGDLEEWAFSTNASDQLRLLIGDATPTGINVRRETDSALSELIKLNVVVVYDGSGGSLAMDGVTLYLNGGVEASTAVNNASYVAMENRSHPVELAVQNTNFGFMDGQMVVPFFTHRQLDATEGFNLNDIYVAMQRATPSTVWRRH